MIYIHTCTDVYLVFDASYVLMLYRHFDYLHTRMAVKFTGADVHAKRGVS